MTTAANDTDAAASTAPSTPAPRRTAFGWSDLITVRIPTAKAELLVNASKPVTSISFAPAGHHEAEHAVNEVLADIAAQASRQLAGQYGQREFAATWLVDSIRDRFDDPTTVALLGLLADAAGNRSSSEGGDRSWVALICKRCGGISDGPVDAPSTCSCLPGDPTVSIEAECETVRVRPTVEPSATGADTDFLDFAVELFEEWLEARPERMVPPADTRSAKSEATRLRDAAHDYLAEGEKGKAADCFDQALGKLLGPRPGAPGAVVMDPPSTRDARADFLAAWDRIAAQNRFLACSHSPEFRRALTRGDRSKLTRGEIECLEAVRLSEDFDLQGLLDWRDSTHASMEKLRKALRRTHEGGLAGLQDERFRELTHLAGSLVAELAALGLEPRR